MERNQQLEDIRYQINMIEGTKEGHSVGEDMAGVDICCWGSDQSNLLWWCVQCTVYRVSCTAHVYRQEWIIRDHWAQSLLNLLRDRKDKRHSHIAGTVWHDRKDWEEVTELSEADDRWHLWWGGSEPLQSTRESCTTLQSCPARLQPPTIGKIYWISIPVQSTTRSPGQDLVLLVPRSFNTKFIRLNLLVWRIVNMSQDNGGLLTGTRAQYCQFRVSGAVWSQPCNDK